MAKVIYLPSGDGGRKTGVDDYLASGKTKDDLLSHATTEIRKPETIDLDGIKHGCYIERGNQLFYRKPGDNQPDVLLCNFTARIVTEEARDDGAEIKRFLAIEVTLASGKSLPRISIPASAFGGMNWILEQCGVAATLSAGPSTRDRVREGIQTFSNADGVEFETVYTHLGWRKIDDEWVYLHAGGAIGAEGVVAGVRVDASGALNLYQLPPPQQPLEVIDAIRASYQMLGVAPYTLTIPLFLSSYRAVIYFADYALYLAGPTGVQKSETAALAAQHFGAGLDARHFIAKWLDTPNDLEMTAFLVKDATLIVDDFAPHGNKSQQEQYHANASRVLRSQGNHQGRGRLRADLTKRPARPPRGLILATGEELPRGHSIRARALILEVAPGDVDLTKLTVCQQQAADGLYASALAAFIRWLAPRLEEIRKRLKQSHENYRAEFISAHGRTTDACAELMFTADLWCEFARDAGLTSVQERETFKAQVLTTLQQVAANQAQHQRDADPVERFGSLVLSVLSSGRGHLVTVSGGIPNYSTRWGFRDVSGNYQAQGPKIGWLPDDLKVDGLYLDREVAYAVVQQLAQQQGETIPISPKTLLKRLSEKGYSVSNQKDRNTFKVTVEGSQQEVIKLSPSYLQKIGIIGKGRIADTNARVNADSAIPNTTNVELQNETIGIATPPIPKTNRDSNNNRDSQTFTESNVDAQNPDYPDSTDIMLQERVEEWL